MNDRASPTASMAFYGRDGFHQAWGQASMFAGEGGRIATLPDVVDARIATPDGKSAAWRSYLTTSTSEFLGSTKGGVPVVAVLHGTGPMADAEGIAAAYSWQFKDKTRQRDGGRVPASVFHQILEREDVAVVETAAFLNLFEYPMSSMTADEALGDPLLAARFGGTERLERYIAVHAKLADADREQQISGPHMRPAGGRGPRIVRSADSSRCGYYRWENFDTRSRTARLPSDGQALAHLLSIGQLSNMHESGDRLSSLQCDVSVHDWNDGTRFLAFRPGGTPGDFPTGIDHRDAVSDPLLRAQMWRAFSPSGDGRGFHALVKVGEEFYTQTPKVGVALDTAEPRHHVRSIRRVGVRTDMVVETAGYYGFFKYALADAERIAPEGANAYRLAGNPEAFDDGNRQRCAVEFFHVDVDAERRLATSDELYRDYELLVSLTEQAA